MKAMTQKVLTRAAKRVGAKSTKPAKRAQHKRNRRQWRQTQTTR